MEHSKFIQAKQFIYSDVKRKINLAYATDNDENKVMLNNIGINGDGNYLAALGLLSYTEFAGKLKYDKKRPSGYDYASGRYLMAYSYQ